MLHALKNTPSIRNKLQNLLSNQANKTYGLGNCTWRMWQRYLRYQGISINKKRKNHFNIQDPWFECSLSIPIDLVERMILLESAPPFAPIETLKDLVLRGVAQEYSFGTHKISIYETITDEHMFLYHDQNLFHDYETTKKLENLAEVTLPLSARVLSVKENKASVQYPTFYGDVKNIDIFYEWMVKPEFCTK